MVPHCCQRITNFSRGSDWRNEVVHELVRLQQQQQQQQQQLQQQQQQQVVHILPMEELTR